MSDARIFISYSHRGEGPRWKSALLRSLHLFEQHHLLDVWQDGKIRVSSFWDDDIKQAMGSARLAVLLLTKEALESEYILNTEFPFLRERQQHVKLRVFPVICEECHWRAHDWLRATQGPNESNPLSQLSEAAQDSIFCQLATEVAEELSRVALAELPKPAQPLSPEQVYLDKFPLTRTTGPREDKLIGREQELALLDLAFSQPHTAIVSLVAWGGVGKTMLVQHWLQRLQRVGWFGTQRVYAWSFYSQGTKEDRQASEDTFLAHALEWFGVQCEPTLSPWDKGRLLADAVARESTLLILDGIEPLQYPPGPMGGQLRAPGVQSLFKQLARKANDTEHRGLCLVTTREPLTDLADFERRPDATWGSVLSVDLGNLTEEAGAALLHHAGAKRAGAAEIKPNDSELLAASREVDGHALTLNLLGRFLARAHGGDIRRRALVKFEEADRKEQGGTTFKMLAAFERWFARSGEFGARQLAVLRILGLFDRPADAEYIDVLRNPPVIGGLTDALFTMRVDANASRATAQPLLDEDWNTAISFLEDFELVTIDDEDGQNIDCHPLIRAHFAEQIRERNPQGWRNAHHRLYEHLSCSTPNQPDTIAGLQPLYQAIAHGCQADLHQDACVKIYQRRILRGDENYSSFKLGAIASDLEAIRHFFSPPWTQVVSSINEYEEGWLLNEAGVSLQILGGLSEARDAFLAALELARAKGVTGTGIVGGILESRARLEMDLGNIGAALQLARLSVTYSALNMLPFDKVGGHAKLAGILLQSGDLAKSLEQYLVAEELRSKSKKRFTFLNLKPFLPFEYSELLLSGAERLAWEHFLQNSTRPREQPTPIGPRLFGWPLLRRFSVTNLTTEVSGSAREEALASCFSVEERNSKAQDQDEDLLQTGLRQLTMRRLSLYRFLLLTRATDRAGTLQSAIEHLQKSLESLRRSNNATYIPLGLLTRAWLLMLQTDIAGSCSDLDEAWDMAERGPMRLHLADIHLYRARLFFREKPYPWKSPHDDLAAAEKLIEDCGYHRRDEELADAKKAILGQALI